MKKIFTLCLSMMMGCMVASAQAPVDEVFQFTDSNGNVIPNGSTFTSKEADNGMGYYEVSSGVFLKNTSDKVAGMELQVNVKSVTNGDLTICFPFNCMNIGPGQHTTEFVAIYPEDPRDIMLHLCVADDNAKASAEVEVQIVRYDLNIINGKPEKAENSYPGSKITVNLAFDGTAGINDVTVAGDSKEVARYTLDGRKLSAPQKGINIVKYADGRTVKVVED